jgi:hypothetical protein
MLPLAVAACAFLHLGSAAAVASAGSWWKFTFLLDFNNLAAS